MGEIFFGKILPTNLFKLQPDVQWLKDWLNRFIAQRSCNIWLLTRHRCPCKRTIIPHHGLRQKDTYWLKPSWSELITLLIRRSLLLLHVCRLSWGGVYVVLENLKKYNITQISKTYFPRLLWMAFCIEHLQKGHREFPTFKTYVE